MKPTRRIGTGIAALAFLLVCALIVPTLAAAAVLGESAPVPARADEGAGVYIVQMSDAPAAAYIGGVPGLEATAPAKGKKLNSLDNDVVKYVDYLSKKHDGKLAKVGAQKTYGYTYSFNGFAATLTARQAADLRADPDVVHVEKTQEVMMDTATTPDFLGLKDATNGLWTLGFKGEDVIIGILDSGIWPESASFSDRDQEGKRAYQQIPGFNGKCKPGEQFNASMCNQKLIAAQYYCAARSCTTGVLPHEFVSARDYNGHGTHTASTAGGNEGTVTTQGAALFGTANGIAPRARIAAYKIGWDNGQGGAGANTGDVVAAIDQSIADGVDVLNYSFSGTQTNYADSVEIAFLFASQAGVFVATSAGNAGVASTVAHISPWLASVAAGTHDRSGSATITLGNGATYPGASLTDSASGNVVLATASGVAGANANLLRQCFSAASNDDVALLDPAKVAGKIVVCERGGAAPANARVDKSVAVREAGGVGVILYNVVASSLNADLHSLPTIHVDHVQGPAIVSYVTGAGASATASLSRAVVNRTAPAPDIAAFSSRGPSRAGGGDILKPDIMAPGQDILAAVAPPGNAGKDFDIYSGTSMSSPHIAGIGALLTQIHPDWSPAAMRSAMATTASASTATGFSGGNSPFNIGSGQVRPNLAINPGLVYEAGFDDYRGFLRGQGLCTFCFGTSPASIINASNLNQPSIAIGSLAGVQTVTRRVTNVGASGTYNVSVVQPAGLNVVVSPTSLVLGNGESASYTVNVTRTTATFSVYAFGSLTWSDGAHSVRSPLVYRPVALAVPAEISGTGASGSSTFTIRTGYTGSLSYGKQGLIPSTTQSGTVQDDPADSFTPVASAFVKAHDFNVAAGTTVLRISMFDPETDGDDDLDLFLYRINADSSLTLVGTSGGATSAEQITLVNPVAANYRLFVHGFATEGPDANYTFHIWKLGTTDAGNISVAGPSSVTLGGTETVTISWSGLTAGQRYLGRVLYQEGAVTHATTILRVDP